MEVWKDVKGYEGVYQVSDLGRVKSLNYNRSNKEGFLKTHLNKGGYYGVSLCAKKRIDIQLHQLVAIVFLGHKRCGHKLVVNHKNFIKTDNRVENLEIVSARENSNRKHIKSSSQFTGVCWMKSNKKWSSSIHINGVKKLLGVFDNEVEASEYYENALIAIKNNKPIKIKRHSFSSEYTGVCFDKKNNKWIAYKEINGKHKNLGRFKTEIEAFTAYKNYSL